MLKKFCTALACVVVTPLVPMELEETAAFAKDVAIYLRDPELCDGVLNTTCGGVVKAPDIRIQARNIESRRQAEGDEPVFTLRAENDLMLEYHGQVFTGTMLHYDFQAHRGILYDARGVLYPWYLGASYIILLPNGDYRLHEGFLSTSPSWKPEWGICLGDAYLSQNRILTATNVQFRIMRLPILWLPYLKTHLDWLVDHPLRYRLRWGGEQGLRFGVAYKMFDNGWFKTFLRLDYRLSRGPGAAIETECRNPDGSDIFLTRNYVARDSSIVDPNERFRYRFQGYYNKCLYEGQVRLNASYDKISDEDMPFDYSDTDLELKTAQKTQINLRGQNDYAIADLTTRIRVNNFETVKEDLPALNLSMHPFTLGPTGIISENRANFGYYDFLPSNLHPDTERFSSIRAEVREDLYRPIRLGCATVTPEVGGLAIFYGNSDKHDSKWVTLGSFGATAMTQVHRYYGCFKHIAEPYVRYQYLTTPNTNPNEHDIFDFNDGWYRLDTLRVGTRHLIYQKWCGECIAHRLTLDLYTYCFFDTPTIGSVVPRLYASAIFDPTPFLRQTSIAVWNAQHNRLDEFNFRTQWTVSDDFAIDAEYRYRSPYYWRRVDPDNFIMDSFRTQAELLHSSLSDRRTTGLVHLYYRLQHDLALEALVHSGWGRTTQPDYCQYQIDLHKTLRSAWNLTFSYQFREDDHRFAIHVKVGLKRPQCPSECPSFSLLE